MEPEIKNPTRSPQHKDYSKWESNTEGFSKNRAFESDDDISLDTEFKGLLKPSLAEKKERFIDLAWFFTYGGNIFAE